MRNCRKCNTKIFDSSGNYCNSCWQIIINDYETDLKRYHYELEIWQNLSISERNSRHRGAEDSNLFFYSLIPFGILLICEYVYGKSLGEHSSNTFLIIYLITIVSGLILSFYLNYVIGRIIRGLIISIKYGSFAALIGYFIGSYLFKERTILITSFIGTVGLILGIYKELRGLNHASAEPRKPSQPNRFKI